MQVKKVKLGNSNYIVIPSYISKHAPGELGVKYTLKPFTLLYYDPLISTGTAYTGNAVLHVASTRQETSSTATSMQAMTSLYDLTLRVYQQDKLFIRITKPLQQALGIQRGDMLGVSVPPGNTVEAIILAKPGVNVEWLTSRPGEATARITKHVSSINDLWKNECSISVCIRGDGHVVWNSKCK